MPIIARLLRKCNRPIGFEIGQEKQAREALRQLEDRIAANVEFSEPEKGPVTVARFVQCWLEQRQGLVADWKTDESRLRHHVLPHLGEMALEDVRPRHLVDLFRKLRVQGTVAPKTLHNIYGVLKALFRDAHLVDLVTTSPCILTEHQLGENVDKDPAWRTTAVYTRDELEALIADPRIPPDRRCSMPFKASRLSVTPKRLGCGGNITIRAPPSWDGS